MTHGQEDCHHQVRSLSKKKKERKKEKKKIHWPILPRKNGRKHKYTRLLLIERNLKEDKTSFTLLWKYWKNFSEMNNFLGKQNVSKLIPVQIKSFYPFP